MAAYFFQLGQNYKSVRLKQKKKSRRKRDQIVKLFLADLVKNDIAGFEIRTMYYLQCL